MQGISWIFWSILIALPAWYWLHRRWMGAHRKDELTRKGGAFTYVVPDLNCKPVDRF